MGKKVPWGTRRFHPIEGLFFETKTTCLHHQEMMVGGGGEGSCFVPTIPPLKLWDWCIFFVKWTTKKHGALLSMRGWWRGIFILVCYSPFYNWLVFHSLFTLNNQTRGPFFHCSSPFFSTQIYHVLRRKPKACQVHVPPGININIAKKRWLVGGFNPVEQY